MTEQTGGSAAGPSLKLLRQEQLQDHFQFPGLHYWADWAVVSLYIASNFMSRYYSGLTLLWWIEARLQAVKKLIKAQLPVGILIGKLNEGINTQAPGEEKHTNTE